MLGNEFSIIISANGLYNFNYTELGGSSGAVTAGVTWIYNQPQIIQIDPCGNYFSSDKIVSFYKYGGSCIKSALLNNAPIKPGTRVGEEGKYSAVITDRAGNMAEKCFVIDRTPPVVNGVENNKVYNSDVTINYVDNLSGIKSAVLNGLNVLPETVVTESGDYTLAITDFADNISERHFKIQKWNRLA